MNIPKIFLALLMLIALAGLALALDTAITVKSPTYISPSTMLQAGAALQNGSPYVNTLTWPSDKYEVILVVNVTTNTGTSPHITIKAGDNPPAFMAGLGDLNFTVAGNGTYFIGPLESARFKTSAGLLKCYGTNITAGTISAIEVRS